MAIKGKVEQFNRRMISGWLAVEGCPDAKSTVELVLDGDLRQVATADRYRPDLEQAGMGNGHCSFEMVVDPPLTKAECNRARLRVGGSALYLEIPRENIDPRPGSASQTIETPGGLKVFIVGSPRSGTSVLLRAIQQEFGLQGSGESHVIPAVAKVIYELRRYYERFRKSTNDLLIQKLPVSVFERSLFDQIRGFYGDTYGNSGWVDKTPNDEAVHSAGIIYRIFPDAKVIVTKRNGIEVVESFRRKFESTVEEGAKNWVSVMQGIEDLTAAHPDILVVDQFDFTNDARFVGDKIASYLDAPQLGRRLENFLNGDRIDKLSSHDWAKRLTLEDVPWDDAEKEAFVGICGPMMVRSGFALNRHSIDETAEVSSG